MLWRDVPMPPQIARLERDPRGYPIPYVAKRYGILLPPPVHPLFGMTMCDDETRPEVQLGFMSEERQRRCFLDYHCQVCFRSVQRGVKWLAGGLEDRPLDTFGFREPWVCGSCLRYAMRVCPGLVTGVRNGALRVVRARECVFKMERMVVTVTGTEQRLYPLDVIPPMSVAAYVRCIVTDGDVLTVDEFLDGRRSAAVR